MSLFADYQENEDKHENFNLTECELSQNKQINQVRIFYRINMWLSIWD